MVPRIAQQNESLRVYIFFREDDNLRAARVSLIGLPEHPLVSLVRNLGMLPLSQAQSHSRQRKPTAVDNNMVQLVLCRVD